MKSNKKGFAKLMAFLKLEKSEISAIYFYAILNGLIQLSLPLGIQAIIGFALGAQMVTSVYVLIFLVVLAVLFVGVLQINQMKIIEKIQQKIFVRYAFEFAEKIPKFDLKQIDKYFLPEKINLFLDTIGVQKGISKLLLDIPIATIQIIFGLTLLSLYHPFFIIFTLLLVIILWLIFFLTSKKGIETSLDESNAKYQVVGWLEEMGRVIKSFKYSQGTHINLLKTDEYCVKYIDSRTAHFRVLLLQFKSIIAFKVSITALMLILGTFLLFSQRLNIGEFVAAEIIILIMINSLEKLIIGLESVYDVITGLYKLDSILENAPEEEGVILLDNVAATFSLDDMSFSYDEKLPLLKNITAVVPRNSVTCISGSENSGKSTFLKLLTGSYSDFSGTIEVNDVPIQSYSLQSLRRTTGIYLYDQDLFAGTLYENITLGHTAVSVEEILALGREIGLGNFISAFTLSFETKIYPMGRTLPNSLVKKILLLRALVNNPANLILEEPWQGFDEKTSSAIKEYLLRKASGKTIVVSTNDQEFIEKAQQHLHIENGSVTKIK